MVINGGGVVEDYHYTGDFEPPRPVDYMCGKNLGDFTTESIQNRFYKSTWELAQAEPPPEAHIVYAIERHLRSIHVKIVPTKHNDLYIIITTMKDIPVFKPAVKPYSSKNVLDLYKYRKK